jgi:ribose transport system substrate-binding protein
MYASSVGVPLQVLQDNGDSQTQTSLLRSLVANGGNCLVVNLDPNTDSDVLPQVKLLTDAGAWVVTVSSIDHQADPWTVSDHWITETAADGHVAGDATAKYLFQAMGGKGNIVALQGILDGLPEQQRYEGLQTALQANPSIKLLAHQTANWDTQTAFNLVQTWLTKYPGQINGIWSANDSMAVGAVEALRSAGLLGKIPVSGTDAIPQAVQDIAANDNSIIVTDDQGAYWQGGMGLALGYMAATGKLNVATMSHDQRRSYTAATVITKANISTELTPPTLDQLKPYWDDPFKLFTGPLTFPAS